MKNDIKKIRDQEIGDRRCAPREDWKNLEPCHQVGSRRHHDRGDILKDSRQILKDLE